MTVREFAKSRGFEVVGRLRRLPDVRFGLDNGRYPLYIDDAGNEYHMSKDGVTGGSIVTHDGGVL